MAKKILHVVPGLQWGGVECWLKRILQRIQKAGYVCEILAPRDKVDKEFVRILEEERIRVHVAPESYHRLKFAASVAKVIGGNGPYTIVHSHLCGLNAAVLLIASIYGVEARVAHSHIDIRSESRTITRRLARWVGRKTLQVCSSAKIACSPGAALSEFGEPLNSSVHIMACGIEENEFKGDIAANIDVQVTTANDPIEGSRPIIINVGRLQEQKNQKFLLNVMKELLEVMPSAHLVLVGEGPDDVALRARIEELDLHNAVTMLGKRSDVAALLVNMADAFVLPSLYEGAPISLVEAQAAGLPSVISSNVSNDGVVIPELVTVMNLSEGASAWATSIRKMLGQPRVISTVAAIEKIETCGLTIGSNSARLLQIYDEVGKRSPRNM